MGLFGIYKAIEYIEREISDLSFKTRKEEIRFHGTNALVLTENLLKEMLYIYGYLFFKANFKTGLKSIADLDDKPMFGTILFALNKIHIFLKDNNLQKMFNSYFNRNFIVFKYRDKYYDMLVDCSRVRAMLLHDDVENVYKLEDYQQRTNDGLNKSLEVLKYFKENLLFPSLVSLKNYFVENGKTIINFTDEIGSTIPLALGVDARKYENNKWYFFKNSNTNILIPVFNEINPLSNGEIVSNTFNSSNSEELTIAPLGYLKVDKYDEIIPIVNNIIYIGRSDENDISFKKSSISRRHCMLEFSDKVFLTDLGSKYGTLLNNVKIVPEQKYELNPNDKISIGLAVEEIVVIYYV